MKKLFVCLLQGKIIAWVGQGQVGQLGFMTFQCLQLDIMQFFIKYIQILNFFAKRRCKK